VVNLKNISPAALIVGWSLLVHIPGITSPLLDYHAHRQCQTASMARNYVRHGMHFLQPEIDSAGIPRRAGTEFPLYAYLIALLYRVFGLHEILGRLMSCAITAWSALFLYKMVEPRLGERTAFWSAIVMCSIPVHIYFTRTVQPESMALWAFIGFVYYLDRWLMPSSGLCHPPYVRGTGPAWPSPILGEGARRAGEGQTSHLLFAVLLGALAPLLKLPFMYLVLGLWGILGLERREAFRSFWFWLIPPSIVLLTMAWYRYTQTAPVQVLPLGPQEQLKNLAPVLSWGLWRDQFISRFPELCTTYSGLVLGIVGATSFRNSNFEIRNPRSGFLWFGWFLMTVVYTGLLGDYGHIHRYTLIPWAPINAVFIAAGIERLRVSYSEYRKGRTALLNKSNHFDLRSSIYGILLVILVIGIPLHAALRIKHWYRLERLWLFQAHDVLARISQPDDLVFTATAEHPVLLYYLDHYGYAADLNTASPQDIDRELAQGARWAVVPTEGAWTAHPEWAAFFARRGRLVYQDPEFLIYQLSSPRPRSTL